MIDEHLGGDYASDKRARLRQLATVVEHEQEELVSAFQSKRITPDQYLERFTRSSVSWGATISSDCSGRRPSTRSISWTPRSSGTLTAPGTSTLSPIEVVGMATRGRPGHRRPDDEERLVRFIITSIALRWWWRLWG